MTTQDLFHISLSACAIVITFFVLLNLYYMFRAVRDLRGITKDAKKKVKQLLTVVDGIREKLEQSVSTAENVTQTAKNVVAFVNDMRSAGASRKKTKRRKTKRKKTKGKKSNTGLKA